MKNIVLCGSMTFIEKMKDFSTILSGMGFYPIVPEEGNWSEINDKDIDKYKRKVSRDHFDKIADKSTYAILVVNEDKNGKKNYIGANTFAEIALAFYFEKEIYILNDIYQPYKDELLAWGSQVLNGSIRGIGSQPVTQTYELISEWREVYKSGSKAIKIYSQEKSHDYVAGKARIQSLVYNAGLPVPLVYGVKEFDGRLAIEMDYVKDESFMDENVIGDMRVEALEVMAALQNKLNAINAESFGLPKFSTLIADEIKQTRFLTEQIKSKVLELLNRLDIGKLNLCHGDFHGGNIIFDGEKHWIIDWDGASTGDPAADACMTYFYEKRFHPHAADMYLHSYCKYSNISQDEILAWQPVIAAYQVNINTKAERDFILSVINKWYSE